MGIIPSRVEKSPVSLEEVAGILKLWISANENSFVQEVYRVSLECVQGAIQGFQQQREENGGPGAAKSSGPSTTPSARVLPRGRRSPERMDYIQ